MTSERIQRRIEQLLDEADGAVSRFEWETVLSCARAVLGFDPGNGEAAAYIAAAERNLGFKTGQAAQGGGSGARPSGEMEAAPAPSPASTAPAFFANGRYTVKRFLGEGGKKRVYLAHDTTLARDVAFALIKTDGLDTEGRERITREAQAMGKLGTHPHVVSVFDMGSEGESPYLVTELMQGGDIEGLLEKALEHRLAIPDAVSLAVQVCRGLEFAHSHGLVHRDLKPGNVWLTADSTAKIGDFGLAVSLDRSRLTRAGMMVGTVSYMPPEQAMGGEVSPRSDLYSLGAMLYEMVTGRPPFVGEESVAIITQHLNVPPVSPAWHRPDCPPGLEALILRLLEKDAAKRPASAAEVRQALEALERGAAPVKGDTAQDTSSQTATAPHDSPVYQRVFVGREAELRRLQAAFDAAVSGQGGLVMVVGEPGIGKTSLCEQLATYVAVRGGRALVGHCYEEGSLSLPYLPFVEAIRSYVLARDPAALGNELGTGAGEVARIVSEVRDRVHVIDGSDGDPDEQRWRLLQAVAGFLRNAGQVQPLLIILEDLHDADRGTIDLLTHLAHHLQGTRLLLVGTYRDVEVDRSHPLSSALAELRRGANFLRVPLRGLTVDEVNRMMNLIRGQEVPWSRAEAIHRQTEGNPLFVQEVLRYLVEEGLVIRQGGSYVRTDGADPDSGIPEGLRDVIGKRLSRLSEKTNQLLSIASVIGREFRPDVLQVIAGLGDDEVIEALEEATERAVVEVRSGLGANILYRFTHAFFRQTLYEEISPPRRIRWHQQVGRALEQSYIRRLDEHAAELAEHFAHSSARDDLEKAVHYGETAARKAMTVCAFGEAARHLERALEVQDVLDPDDRAKRCDLLLALAEAQVAGGHSTLAVEQTAPDALALAETLDDRPRAARACLIALNALTWSTATAGFSTGPGPRWAALADRYAAPGTVDRVYAEMFIGFTARAQGDEGAALRHYEAALTLASAIDHPVAFVESAVFLLAGQAAPPTEYLKLFDLAQEVEAKAHSLTGAKWQALVLVYIGMAYLSRGDRERAEDFWERAREAAARSGDAMVALHPLQVDVLRAVLDGSLDAVPAMADRLRARAIELDRETFGRQAGARVSRRAFLYLGRTEEALSGIPQTQHIFSGGGVYAAQQAMCLAHMGRPDEARAILQQFLASRDLAQPEDTTSAAVMRYLLEAAVIAGDTEAARVLEQRMAPLSGVLHLEAGQAFNIGRLCGGAAALLGDPARAREHYHRGLDVCLRARFRPEVALTRLELAELLLEHYPEEQAEALDHLDFAISELREMRMQPALERALKYKGLLHA